MTSKNVRGMYFKKKKDRFFVRNQNWNAVIVGPTGSGKTYGALTISDELMDGKHDPEIHQIFSMKEFMTKLTTNKFKKGDLIVFEEAGVNISSKDWQSKANKNMNKVLQTCRHRNFGIIFTLPMFKFLDASVRDLIHTLFMTDEIDYNKNIAYLKVYDFKIDSFKGKEPMRIFPKFWHNGTLVTLKRVAVKLPRKEIREPYEIRKLEFTDKLNNDIMRDLEHDERQENKKLNKGSPCGICGLCSWEYRKRDKFWLCRKCGAENYINPYVKNEVVENE